MRARLLEVGEEDDVGRGRAAGYVEGFAIVGRGEAEDVVGSEIGDLAGRAVRLADIVNRADVRVVQCRGRLGLALETGMREGSLETASGRNFSATKRLRRVSSAL